MITARSSQTAKPLVRLGLVVLAAAAGGAVVHFGLPLCPTALFLGVPCPGCGLTRAALALVHGDLGTAYRLHPLAPVLVPLIVVGGAREATRFVLGVPRVSRAAPPPQHSTLARAWGACVVVMAFALVGVWVARFAGYFGGPVPVRSLRSLATEVAASSPAASAD